MADKSNLNDIQIDDPRNARVQLMRSVSEGSSCSSKRSSTLKRPKSIIVELITSETDKSESNQDIQVPLSSLNLSRLLQSDHEGIRERIELLCDLISCTRNVSIPDSYDEMSHIVEAMDRNERLKQGPNGARLLELTNAAKSNLNIDLHKLDEELQRQFGLYSVEVVGDGACALRAILISGLGKPDLYHSELREKAIEYVLSDMKYYSTVLIPGEQASDKQVLEWAQSMRDPYTYCDEMANIAIADRYHVQLVIFRAGELLTVVNPRDGYVEHTAFLVNVGTHYKALVPRHELEQARLNSERLCK